MKIIFLCGARDFHAMDWYRSAKKKLGRDKVAVMADIIEAEGMESLLQPDDEIIKLHILDKWLFRKPSHWGDIWRNALKLMILPLQVRKLKKFYKSHPSIVIHAHGMYYMQIACRAGVPYVGTPQGSEILVRPYRSSFYWRFAKNALMGAKAVTVDSENMKRGVEKISGVVAHIVQNGIDIKSISDFLKQDSNEQERTAWLSMRGLTPLYRERELITARNESSKFSGHPIDFVYPFFDDNYLEQTRNYCNNNDKFLGRMQRDDLYAMMKRSAIVFSIPSSDSSPRSVYEAIFLGCPVVITANAYYNKMPVCMQQRVVIADIEKHDWFDNAVEQALALSKLAFEPTQEAIDLFDQEKNFECIYALLTK